MQDHIKKIPIDSGELPYRCALCDKESKIKEFCV